MKPFEIGAVVQFGAKISKLVLQGGVISTSTKTAHMRGGDQIRNHIAMGGR